MSKCDLILLFANGANASIKAEEWTNFEVDREARIISVYKNEIVSVIAPLDNLLCIYKVKAGAENG